MAYRWQEITDSLRAAIGAGQYPRGSRLPTEAELADSFAVNRGVSHNLGWLTHLGLVFCCAFCTLCCALCTCCTCSCIIADHHHTMYVGNPQRHRSFRCTE